MPNYLCRPAVLNSSSPVLPEGAHTLEENLKRRGEERKRQMERGRGTERERERERERGGKYRVQLHEHTYMDNLTCMLLVRLWRSKLHNSY